MHQTDICCACFLWGIGTQKVVCVFAVVTYKYFFRETLLRKDQGYQVEAGSESETEDPPITALRVNDLTFVAPKSTEKLCIGV